MTLNKIKAMFVPGDRWLAIRESPATVIHGNVGVVNIPASHSEETRVVKAVHTATIQFGRPGMDDVWTPWPKAREVLEASQGVLRFQYEDGKVAVLLRKLP